MKAGLNMFSLNRLIKSESDFYEAALRLADMGYSYLQVSNLPLEADAVARVGKASGLPIYLTHFPLDRILNDTDAVLRENDTFGCRNIGLGYFAPDIILDEKKCCETVGKLDSVAKKIRRHGFTLFLHNHHNEFYRRGGKTVFDYIADNAPNLHFIVDTYWVQYGGENPVRIFERLKGRAECVHLKDYRLGKPKADSIGCVPDFAPVGSGTLDFKAVVKAATDSGAEYFFVEQDNACDHPDPWGQVKQSIDYIKENL